MKSYTSQQEDNIWGLPTYPDMYETDYGIISSFINTTFRSFGESLAAVINKKADKVIDEPKKYIEEACKAANIDISEIASRNTFKNWFSSGMRPKKSESSRRSMFVLAFALGLSVEETEELFSKAYLDRSFNHRDYKELIYYYCINRGLSYSHAKHLIEMVNVDEVNPTDSTVYTTMIKSDVDTISEDGELLKYIENHKHNLSINNKRALELLETYKEKAYPFVESKDGMHDKSAKSLFEAITGQEVKGKSGTTTLKFKDRSLPDEIRINFPQVHNLTYKNQSYEELRKTLILVFSYWFWSNLAANNDKYIDKDNKLADAFDGYKDELNMVLFEANMPSLYLGNPYDWMFAYCTYTENPLYTFQSIMDVVFGPEE